MRPVVADAANLGDGATYRVVADPARYAPFVWPYDGVPFIERSYVARPWAQAALFATGTRTIWRGDVGAAAPFESPVPVVAQRADAMIVAGATPSADRHYPLGRPGVRLARTADALRTYAAESGVGGREHFCRDLRDAESGPARLEQVP